MTKEKVYKNAWDVLVSEKDVTIDGITFSFEEKEDNDGYYAYVEVVYRGSGYGLLECFDPEAVDTSDGIKYDELASALNEEA
jgi:hypothetical protein